MQRYQLALLAALATASPAAAQAQTMAVPAAEARKVLDAYTSALGRREVGDIAKLFTADAAVLEGGKYEGRIGQYLEHHLGPELAAFDSFEIKDRKVDVQVRGDVAWAREEYAYLVRVKGREGLIQRQGVSTAVLVQTAGCWRIAQLHLSSRAR